MENERTPNFYCNGEYVIIGIPNAYNKKTGYWISKKDCTVSLYCFTADRKLEVNRQLKNGWPGYINYFEDFMKRLRGMA